MNNSRQKTRKSTGYSLLEVLIGMVIFALGMLALAQLQGNLSKSSADSNARSVAINVAEEFIEDARSFSQVDVSAGVDAFNDIVSGTSTEFRGGINYEVSRVVTDYYYHEPAAVNGNGTFKANDIPSGVAEPDMKMLQVTVAWGNGQTFQIDQAQAGATLGSGSITLTDMISSFTSPSGGKVLLNSTTDSLYGPPVDYSPGENPDIVSIQLGENRFKESTKPLPKVFNANERVETSFDVVTYSQDDEGSTFLRREEFLAVACECVLRVPDSTTEGGLRPTLWNGNDYTEGEFVSKPYGESVRDNNQNFQSEYCGVCCRDHHDGGTGTEDVSSDTARSKYNPFRGSSDYMTGDDGASGLVGDHKHYGIGGTSLADSDGDTYFEACRMVRKDGFFRVAQDLRQEGLNSFPETYLDDDNEIGVYSKYVTDAITAYTASAGNGYEQSGTPSLTKPELMPTPVNFPGNKSTNRTSMTSYTPNQQLRGRGIYMDYLTDELRDIIDCLNDGDTGQTCGVGASNTALEIIPFYDVQLTWLGRWNEAPTNLPIEVTNDEAIQTGNTHDRGFAELTSGSGNSDIDFEVNKGNLGLTGSDPIDPGYTGYLENYVLYALAAVGEPPPITTGWQVDGTITSTVGGVKASDVEIQAINGVQCDRTSLGFECVVPYGASNPRLRVDNYFKRNKNLVACSEVLTIQGTEHSGDTPESNWTRFNMPQTANITNAHIVIMEGTVCP